MLPACRAIQYFEPSYPQKFNPPWLVVLEPGAYVYHIHMIYTKNASIAEGVRGWLARQKHDIAMISARIHQLLCPAHIIGGVVDAE